MPDYLSCGGCQSDFELSDILQFIEHKRYNCNVTASPELAMELLECVKCLRKFHTPWPLLLHVQSEHHIAVVRNLVLPSITSPVSRQSTSFPVMSTKTAQTQTVKTCLKRLVCPYQANLPAQCCLKVEAPSEDSCCCLETGEKTDTSNGLNTCQQSFVLNSSNSSCASEAIANTQKELSSNRPNASQPKGGCPCDSNSFSSTPTETVAVRQTVCCSTSNNVNSPCNPTVTRSRVQSCCDPTQTLLPVQRSSECCVAKTIERTRISMYQNASTTVSSCPCKPSSNTVDQTCQTDFAETLDIDMDLLLDSDDLNVAIESTFSDDNNHPTILAPSKAIQTIAHGNNIGNCTVPSQTLIPTEMIPVTSESSQSGTRAYHTNSVAQSEQTLTPSINQFRSTFPTTREEVRGPYIYNQENASTLDHINTDTSLQVWENQEVTETVEVDNSESLLNLLGSSAAITASFTKSHLSQRQTTQLMQSAPGIPSRAHSLLLDEPKRKRNARDYRFNCSECDKVFRQNVHLRKHVMAKHTKQKPHKCTYCRYTTVEKSHLTVHIRTHTGEKPFRCRICNYSTAQNCTLKSHYLRKHPDSKVKCGICGMDFITNHERDKHEKVCRRDDTYTSIDTQHLPETAIFSKLDSDGVNELVDQSV